jgi:DNA-binding CsgD family transcriptional regulator
MRNSSYLSVMARLSRADLESVLAFTGEAAEHDGPEPLPAHLLDSLKRLVPADGVCYQEGADASNTVTYFVEAPEVPLDASTWELLGSVGMSDPICSRSSLPSVVKLSDFFVSVRAVRRNPFWAEALRCYQPFGGPYHLKLWLDGPKGASRTLGFTRGKRDFSERDRALMTVLRPHLNRLRANIDLQQRAFLEAPDGLALTRRELEVMRWVARGKTNAEIAGLLYISPGTVRRHLDNAYAKLDVHTRTAAVARTFPGLMQLN